MKNWMMVQGKKFKGRQMEIKVDQEETNEQQQIRISEQMLGGMPDLNEEAIGREICCKLGLGAKDSQQSRGDKHYHQSSK